MVRRIRPNFYGILKKMSRRPKNTWKSRCLALSRGLEISLSPAVGFASEQKKRQNPGSVNCLPPHFVSDWYPVKYPLPVAAATEARNPASLKIDTLTPLQLVQVMNEADAAVPAAVASQAPAIARAITEISGRMRQGGRLIYAGAGTSGRLGVLDAAECPPTFSVPPGMVTGVIAGGLTALTNAVEGAEDDSRQGAADLLALNLTSLDSVMGIAASGRTPWVLGAITAAREAGCLTLGLACNAGSVLADAVDIMITPVVGPEIITGSTRLKAGTATKLVLNTLTTGIMVQLGKTLGNLMVDLKATNEKLQDRAVRIVSEITGLAGSQATEILQQCSGEVKTAVVVSLTGLSPAEARQRLQSCAGQLRQALVADR